MESNKYNLYVVYYINCLINKNYMDWPKHQLKYITDQINNNNIISLKKLNKVKIFIVATIKNEDKNYFINELNNIYPETKFEIDFYNEEEYEYRGINKVWELGQKYNNNNDIILYYHSKGMSRTEKYSQEKDKYNNILKDLNKIFDIYDNYKFIDKIGYSCSNSGFMWYNFWYARGSYINFVEKPIKTERRHYYEDWLSRFTQGNNSGYINTPNNCYSLVEEKNVDNIGYYYCPEKDDYFKY